MRVLQALRAIDPTGTTVLRARFVADVDRRFRALETDVRKTIVDEDAFGMRRNVEVNQPAVANAFAFSTSTERVAGFMDWLERQERAGILERASGSFGTRGGWTDLYVDSAYRKGIRDAIARTKQLGGGPPLLAFGDEVGAAFVQPTHVDAVRALYSRTFEDLKTVIAAANGEARRVLADTMSGSLATSIAEGRAPLEAARRLARDVNGRLDVVGRNRARMIARTEIVRAHQTALLNEYERAGFDQVEVLVEVLTAGFDVCPKCLDLASRGPYTIAQARGLFPAHPNCRCSFRPRVKGRSTQLPFAPVPRKPRAPRVPRVKRVVVEPIVERKEVLTSAALLGDKRIQSLQRRVEHTRRKLEESAEKYRQRSDRFWQGWDSNPKVREARVDYRAKWFSQVSVEKPTTDNPLYNELVALRRADRIRERAITRAASARRKLSMEIHARIAEEKPSLKLKTTIAPSAGAKVTRSANKATEWIEKVVVSPKWSEMRIDVMKDTRGRAMARPGMFLAKGSNLDLKASTVFLDDEIAVSVHEFGHTLEYSDANVRRMAFEFLERRSGTEAPQRLAVLFPGFNYRWDEIAVVDRFITPYVGKITGRGTTEIVSMGLQYLYEDPLKFARSDPEHFDLIMRIIKGATGS